MHLLIFDLDGTLIDSKLDLAHSVNATARSHGYGAARQRAGVFLCRQRRAGLIRRALGPEASEEDVASALEFFIRYYSAALPGKHQPLPRRGGSARAAARRPACTWRCSLINRSESASTSWPAWRGREHSSASMAATASNRKSPTRSASRHSSTETGLPASAPLWWATAVWTPDRAQRQRSRVWRHLRLSA